jgi:hypothetical protein
MLLLLAIAAVATRRAYRAFAPAAEASNMATIHCLAISMTTVQNHTNVATIAITKALKVKSSILRSMIP